MLTIGSDPEVFLFDTKSKSYVSSIGKIGGSKREPRLLERKGFALQEDNVATEFNIPPATNLKEFVESIQWSIKRIKKEVKSYGLTVAVVPSAVFPDSELKHPKALAAGCDPDFNAWTGFMNPRPQIAKSNLRTGGGHIHIGCNYTTKQMQQAFVKSMDLNLGIGSVIMDKDTVRKQLYGKAGAFRPTSYGLEYRVLSNFWLTSKKLISWAYNQTNRAYEMLEERGEGFFNELGEEIQACINTSDVKASKDLLKRYNIGTI